MTSPGSPGPLPGWYPDASGYADQRYWDGTKWTEHYARAGQSVSPPPPPGFARTAAGESAWQRGRGYWTALPKWGRTGGIALLLVLLIAAAVGDDGPGDDPKGQAEAAADVEADEAAERAKEEAAEKQAAEEAKAEEARAAKAAARVRAAKARAAKARARRARARARARELRRQQAEAQREQEALEAQLAAEQAAAEQSAGAGCEPGYSPCVPSYPPDVNCPDVGGPISVTGSDPHGLDADGDAVACE